MLRRKNPLIPAESETVLERSSAGRAGAAFCTPSLPLLRLVSTGRSWLGLVGAAGCFAAPVAADVSADLGCSGAAGSLDTPEGGTTATGCDLGEMDAAGTVATVGGLVSILSAVGCGAVAGAPAVAGLTLGGDIIKPDFGSAG